MEYDFERKWTRVNKEYLTTLVDDHERYRFMFRVLFAYLIFDIILHLGLLN